MASLQQLCKELLSLESSDLRILQSRIQILLDYGTTADASASASTTQFEQELYQAISTALELRHQHCPPWAILIKQPVYKTFLKHAAQLHTYNAQFNVKKPQRINFYIYSVKLICERLATKNIPVTLTTVINSIHFIHNIIERAFPGYQANGLLHWVIASMDHK